MFFSIETSGSLPIYEQLVRQVKFAVASGVLRPGEQIASVRELARELTINPNTVARAYRQLRAEGVLEPVRGTGMAIAAAAKSKCRTERNELVRARLRQALQEARHSQLAAGEILAIVEEELASLEQEQPQT